MLTILHSNDLHSRFDAWARMETVAKRIRAELGADAVLRLDAGDHADRASSATYPVLAADLSLVDGRPVPGFTGRVTVWRSGLTVGIFGITPDLAHFLTPLGLARRRATDVAAENVRELRAAGCDLVVLLSHMGYDADKVIAAAVPGIDVIVGGHTHTALPRGEQVGRTVIVQAGE